MTTDTARIMEEEVYHAELANASRDTNILNGVAGVTVAVAIVFLILGISYGEMAKLGRFFWFKKIEELEFLFGREVI